MAFAVRAIHQAPHVAPFAPRVHCHPSVRAPQVYAHAKPNTPIKVPIQLKPPARLYSTSVHELSLFCPQILRNQQSIQAYNQPLVDFNGHDVKPVSLKDLVLSPQFRKYKELTLIDATDLREGIFLLTQKLARNFSDLKNLGLQLGLNLTQSRLLGTALKTNNTLDALDLSHNHFGDTGAKSVLEGVNENLNLKKLNLSCNEITDQSSAKIKEMLERNKTLKRLYLYNNQLGDVGASLIGQALEKNTTLRILSIPKNAISNGDLFKSLKSNTTLEWLNLSFNQLGDDALPMIKQLLKTNKTLTRLDLSNNKFSNPTMLGHLLDQIKSNPDLEIIL